MYNRIIDEWFWPICERKYLTAQSRSVQDEIASGDFHNASFDEENDSFDNEENSDNEFCIEWWNIAIYFTRVVVLLLFSLISLANHYRILYYA